MPYAPYAKSKSITVHKIDVTLEADHRWVAVHPPVESYPYPDKAKFTVKVYVDDSPADRYVRLMKYDPSSGTWKKIKEGRTGSDGEIDFMWKPGISQACKDWRFAAVDNKSSTWSSEVRVAVAYPTIIDFTISPSEVSTGHEFTVSGTLKYYNGTTFKPLNGRTVRLLINDSEAGSKTTADDGSFIFTHVLNTPGEYSVKVVFDGEGIPAGSQIFAPAQREATVTVTGEAVGPPTGRIAASLIATAAVIGAVWWVTHR